MQHNDLCKASSTMYQKKIPSFQPFTPVPSTRDHGDLNASTHHTKFFAIKKGDAVVGAGDCSRSASTS
nr:hypothetical protein SEVIR_1G108625v2 [Setaria viridis]